MYVLFCKAYMSNLHWSEVHGKKKKIFSLLEPLLLVFFQWALLVHFLEQGHHKQGRWWHLLLSVVTPTPTLAFPSAKIVSRQPSSHHCKIFHRNIKHLIISEGEMQHGGHEKQTCRQDRAPWCMDGPRSRCFVLELRVKPTQGVHSVAATMGNSIFGERQKIQNSSVCYMGEEICRRESGRGQQLHLKGKNIFWCPDIFLKRGIFFWPAGWNTHVENSPLL